MKSLENELAKLEQSLSHRDKSNQNISHVGVAWHLDHSLKVINSICGMLATSDPAEYHWKFNFPRHIVFTLSRIPRGKGRSPKAVLPPGEISKEALVLQIGQAREAIEKLNSLPPKSNFKHPYFGVLNLKQSQKFMRLHSAHHLKIIRDIVA
jgi:hypothetical protein